MKSPYVTDEEKQIKAETLSSIAIGKKSITYILAFLGLMIIMGYKPNIKSFISVIIYMGIFWGLLVSGICLLYNTLTLFIHKRKVDAFLFSMAVYSFSSFLYFVLPLTLVLHNWIAFYEIEGCGIFILTISLSVGFLLACFLFPKKAKEIEKDIQNERKEAFESRKRYILRLLELEREGKKLSPQEKAMIKQLKKEHPSEKSRKQFTNKNQKNYPP